MLVHYIDGILSEVALLFCYQIKIFFTLKTTTQPFLVNCIEAHCAIQQQVRL